MKHLCDTAVLSNVEVAEDTYVMWFDAPPVAREGAPGQFIMVRCGGHETRLLLRRPMSLYRFGRDAQALGGEPVSVAPDAVSILYEVVGKGTRWLSGRKPGDRVNIIGPLGNGFTQPLAARKLLVVFGGIGIGGVMSLVDKALREGREVRLLYGARTAKKLAPLPYDASRALVQCATDDGTAGHRGRVTDLIDGHIGWADAVFACGPTPMFASMARRWKERGWKTPCEALLEARMGCGLGACYACSIETAAGYKRVCTYGPKYDLRELVFPDLTATRARASR
ncbi:MAG: dihydroorotate dehydrogenase electron transfer subunit [Chloroflexi bacterium]|nr:dihydroorotate dehydrogenase electron transfer subunit [Chloroflexota bacterium]